MGGMNPSPELNTLFSHHSTFLGYYSVNFENGVITRPTPLLSVRTDEHVLPCDLLRRSDLHLSELQRVEMAFPLVPIYALSLNLHWNLATFKVLAIQVASVAFLKPPATSEVLRTRNWIWVLIVVPVFSAELHSNMISHRITYTDNMAVHRTLAWYFTVGLLFGPIIVSSARVNYSALQRVMNAAARVIMNLSLRDHVKPTLKQLHWLPVEQRIIYKLCLFMHYIHIGQAPKYRSGCVSTVSAASDRCRLRSTGSAAYVLRRTRTNFGERGFFY